MLNGPFVESNRAIISLEEDCPLALCFALEIIYSRFGEEPFEAKKMTTALAYDEELDVAKESASCDDEEWQEMEASMAEEALNALVDKYELVVVRSYQEEVERRGEMIHLRSKVKTLEKAVLYEANEKKSAMGMMSTMSLQLGYSGSMIWQMKSQVDFMFYCTNCYFLCPSHSYNFVSTSLSIVQEMQNMRQTQGICASFNHSTTRMYEENMRLRNEISRLKQVVVRAREMNCLAIDELMGQE